ncbi:MAG: hypothetical protein KAU31_05690, partial [Spirochaetaceae bacterium]|nr:hypothetical protein [Spirochaetaceae bacterium]
YWEHRGVYAFEELSQISEADLVQVDLLLTGLLESNSNYADVITEYIVDPSRGLVIFAPEDAVGFYPRPFPGLFPYTHAVSPGNPFDPANSVYSDLNAAAEADSVNTLRLRFSGESAGFTINEVFIQGSVTVSVAGRQLDRGQYTVDDFTGVVSIADGIVSPESSVTIQYRRAGDQDVARSLLAAASADWSRDGFTAHGMVAVDVPFPEPAAPALGQEQPIGGIGSAELRYHRGTAGGSELSAALWGGARVGDPNAHDVALIAGMDDGSERFISLEASEWQLASDSSLLPAAPALVSLSRRGDLVFEDYYDDSLIGGGLRTLSWDNSANRSFTYAQKAGPYSTADS